MGKRDSRVSDRIAAHAATGEVDGLRKALGPGLWMPTHFRPHLVAARRRRKDKLAARHGVSFRRVDGDCLVEAENGASSISILLEGEGAHAPSSRVVVPANACKLIAESAADDVDLAELWFRGPTVIVRAGEAWHEFRVIEPELPFAGDNLRDEDNRGRQVSGLALDATQLSLIQRALGAPTLGVRYCRKRVVALWPEDDDTGLAVGFLVNMGEEG